MWRPGRVLSCWLPVGLLLGACRIAAVAQPTPLLGPTPHTVLVWPAVAAPFAGHGEALLAGLDESLRGRGYDVRSLAVGRELLAQADLLGAEPPDLARVGAGLAVDAVLQLRVDDFAATGDGLLQSARWDLTWQLLSTHGEGVLWRYAHHGSWQRRERDTSDPLRRFDAEPDIVPIGGNRTPDYRDVADLAAWLHHEAMAHLPRWRS